MSGPREEKKLSNSHVIGHIYYVKHKQSVLNVAECISLTTIANLVVKVLQGPLGPDLEKSSANLNQALQEYHSCQELIDLAHSCRRIRFLALSVFWSGPSVKQVYEAQQLCHRPSWWREVDETLATASVAKEQLRELLEKVRRLSRTQRELMLDAFLRPYNLTKDDPAVLSNAYCFLGKQFLTREAYPSMDSFLAAWAAGRKDDRPYLPPKGRKTKNLNTPPTFFYEDSNSDSASRSE